MASGMPAAADTGSSGACGCPTTRQADQNPGAGRAVINEELSEGDDVVVEFIPSDLPAGPRKDRAPVPAFGDTAVSGGDVENTTSIAVDASGGDADADAGGGDLNLVEVVTRGQGDVDADAGSGGTADADASGGVVVIGNVNSGNNQGSEIEVNQFSTGRLVCYLPSGKALVEVPARYSLPAGNVEVDAGSVSNETTIAVDASGGEAEADASGGDGNIVIVSGRGNTNASAGTGGTADADASGGAVVIGNVNTGGNQGSQVTVGGNAGDGQGDRELTREERRAARQGGCVPPPCQVPGAVNTVVEGGDVSNTTDIAVDASGGDASADASGGDDNLVQVETSGQNVTVDASAGTGGTAGADASGGVVEIGTVRSGGNTGSDIRLNNVAGRLLCLSGNDSLLLELDFGFADDTSRRGRPDREVTGGTVTNETEISVSAAGGEAEADASGGDGNIVITGGRGNTDASAGSGGTADADASGGTIVIGDVNSGGNRGNDIDDDDDDDD